MGVAIVMETCEPLTHQWCEADEQIVLLKPKQ